MLKLMMWWCEMSIMTDSGSVRFNCGVLFVFERIKVCLEQMNGFEGCLLRK